MENEDTRKIYKNNTGLRGLVLGAGLVFLGGFVGWSITDQYQRNELEPQVYEVVSKIDKSDGHATEAEWIKAYEFLNKKYNARNPDYLSKKELRKIISHFSK